jgi:hypothetical protein
VRHNSQKWNGLREASGAFVGTVLGPFGLISAMRAPKPQALEAIAYAHPPSTRVSPTRAPPTIIIEMPILHGRCPA